MTIARARLRMSTIRGGVMAMGLACAWLAVRNAAIGVFDGPRPVVAAAFRPAAAMALATMARDRFVAAGGSADAETVRLAEAALRGAPAAALPLVLAGLVASAHGETGRALRLMQMARARDPREPIARYWLLDRHIRDGRYRAGLDAIEPALRLRPEAGPALFALVAGLSAVPDAGHAVEQVLARDPDWRAAFFASQAVGGRQPLALLELLRALPPAHDPAAALAEQRSVLYAAVHAGAYDAAYAAWRGFVPATARARPGAVYDPTFRGRPGPEPFNWIVQRSGEARAATPGGQAGTAGAAGLEILSYGAARSIVAEQYVPASGRRMLLVEYRTGSDPAGPAMARVACARDDSSLAEIVLAGERRLQRRTISLVVPRGCGAVRLQIVALPSDAARQGALTITAMDLTPE